MASPVGRTIGLTLLLGLAAAEGCYSGGPLGAPPSATDGTLTQPTRRLRRLSSREYDNVVHDLLGDTSQPALQFVVDSYQNGYDNGSAGLAVQSDQVLGYQAAAEALAGAAVAKEMPRLLGGCSVADRGEDECVDAFLATTAARAFRRPLTDTEAARLRDAFAQDAYAEAGGFTRGIQTMLEIVLQSPEFLYREELGALDATPSPGASVHLTDYEVASELSFLLTGSIPDDALWSDVQNARFRTVDDYRRVTTRLLGTPGAKDALRAFMHEWLATDSLPTLSKDPAFYPTFDRSMALSMSHELDAFYEEVLFSGSGTLRNLFTTTTTYADATMGNLYGVPTSGTALQPVSLDPSIRKGILTRAGFLAAHAATDSSGPIGRGVFVMERIMCSPPPQPPANVPPAPPAGDPSVKNETTRQRYAAHVSSQFCAGCHTQIDGIGFGFEEFDGIGAYRTVENGQPVDDSGTVLGTGEIDGDYRGVGQLAEELAGSHLLARCFAVQAYRYAMGQIEPGGDDPAALAPAFDTDAQLTDVFLALVASPIFVNRTFEPAP